MNKPPVISNARRPGTALRVWLFIGLFFLLSATYVVANVVSFFRLHRDERVLRDAVLNCAPATTALRMEFAVGPWTLGLARCVTSFLDLPREARMALGSVESAEVGVYKFEEGSPAGNRAAMFTKADAAMTSRGWERMVGVVQEDHTVAVYVPVGLEGKRLKFCVLVVTPNEMVIAGGVTQMEPLIELAASHLPPHASRLR